jgi:intracellular septation protein A
VLILESDLFCFGSLTVYAAEGDFLQVKPSLIRQDIFEVRRCAHIVVQLELLPEAFVEETRRSHAISG